MEFIIIIIVLLVIIAWGVWNTPARKEERHRKIEEEAKRWVDKKLDKIHKKYGKHLFFRDGI